MALTTDILRSYRQPRAMLRRRLEGGVREDRALAYLMLACFLVFISQWPRLARIAEVEGRELQPLIGGALLGWLFMAPLIFYLLAGLTRLVASVFGGQGTGYGERMALFWTLLVISPLWLLHGLTAGMIGESPALTLVGAITALAFITIWGILVLDVERPAATPLKT